MAKVAKKQVNQTKTIELFIQWCGDNSPFAVLTGIVASFIFCAVIDYCYFGIVFQNVFYGTVAIFCALFIFVVRGALLFHSFKGFSEGKSWMGVFSAAMQMGAVIWVCYEAPKVSALLVQMQNLQQDASTNFIRAVAVTASLLEVLMIMSIFNRYAPEEEETDEENTTYHNERTFEEKPSTNGHHKTESVGNSQALKN
jgi:hypothetical protein